MQYSGVLRAVLLSPVRAGGNLEWGACVIDGWPPMPVIVTNAADFIRFFGVARSDMRPSNPVAGALFYDTNLAQLMYYNGDNWLSVAHSV